MHAKCSVEGCERPFNGKGLCMMHYMRLINTGEVGQAAPIKVHGRIGCTVKGCDRDHKSMGLCSMHYLRFRKNGDAGEADPLIVLGRVGCVVNDCELPHKTNGYCKIHHHFASRYPDLDLNELATMHAGGCVACGSFKSLCVDHNHKTGKVREILCDMCNKAVGYARDNPDLLVTLALYVLRHSESLPVLN